MKGYALSSIPIQGLRISCGQASCLLNIQYIASCVIMIHLLF